MKISLITVRIQPKQRKPIWTKASGGDYDYEMSANENDNKSRPMERRGEEVDEHWAAQWIALYPLAMLTAILIFICSYPFSCCAQTLTWAHKYIGLTVIVHRTKTLNRSLFSFLGRFLLFSLSLVHSLGLARLIHTLMQHTTIHKSKVISSFFRSLALFSSENRTMNFKSLVNGK